MSTVLSNDDSLEDFYIRLQKHYPIINTNIEEHVLIKEIFLATHSLEEYIDNVESGDLLEQLEKKISELETLITKIKTEVNEAKENSDEIKNKLAALEKEEASKNKTIDELEEEDIEVNTLLDNAEKDLKEQYDALKTTDNEIEEEINVSKSTISNEVENSKTLFNDLDITGINNDIANLKQTDVEIKNEIVDNHINISNIIKDLFDFDDDKDVIVEITNLKNKDIEIKTSIGNLEKDYEESSTALEKANKQFIGDIVKYNEAANLLLKDSERGSLTPVESKIPIAGNDGLLNSDWILTDAGN